MKFVADVMLGKLAKQMRLLGFDVLYDPTLNDNELIRLSLEQDRVLLTRDTALSARPLAIDNLFIISDRIPEQLDQVLSAFPAEIHPLTRCSRCNEILALIEKKDAQDLVPQYVYEKTDGFMQCPKCKRIYWQGTHVRRITMLTQNKKPVHDSRTGTLDNQSNKN